MFNLCMCRQINYVFKGTSDKLLCNNKYWVSKKTTQIFEVVQIKHYSPFPPPPGVNRTKPRPIPFADNQAQPREGGRSFLILIPIITFGLGTWQLKRLKWKTELINNINERISAEPIPLPITDSWSEEDSARMEFTKVIVKGTFDHENEFYYGPKPCLVKGERDPNVIDKSGSGRKSYGYNLVTPLVLSGTGEKIIVNRGWIPTDLVNPSLRPWSKTEGEQTIVGLIRSSEPVSSIAPATHLEYKVWHYRDIADMATKKKCLPIYVDATEEHSIPGKLWGGQTPIKPRNEHLTYLITWYGLSISTAYLWSKRYMKR